MYKKCYLSYLRLEIDKDRDMGEVVINCLLKIQKGSTLQKIDTQYNVCPLPTSGTNSSARRSRRWR
jgi:hypothetical protein